MTTWHFLRPMWFTAFIPLLFLWWQMVRKRKVSHDLLKVCDPHLLAALFKDTQQARRYFPDYLLVLSISLTIIALAGPTWSRLPVPHYQSVTPKIMLLDLSDAMQKTDIPPDRVTRARFKVRDILLLNRPTQKPTAVREVQGEGEHRTGVYTSVHEDSSTASTKQFSTAVAFPEGPYALIAYTSMPFIVSPLTDDPDTIDVLLDQLTPDIMPVSGHDLVPALQQTATIIAHAGFSTANVLILTAHPPSQAAIDLAKQLADKGIHLSILPLSTKTQYESRYLAFANAGAGAYLPFTNDSTDIVSWLSKKPWLPQYQQSQHLSFAFRDEGRLFLIPVLMLLLPIFRRGWFARVNP